MRRPTFQEIVGIAHIIAALVYSYNGARYIIERFNEHDLPSPPRFGALYIAIGLSVLMAISLLSRILTLFRSSQVFSKNNKLSLLDKVGNKICDDYNNNNPDLLLSGQYLLRFLGVFYVGWSCLAGMTSEDLRDSFLFYQLLAILTYELLTVYLFVKNLNTLGAKPKPHSEEHTQSPTGLLFKQSLVDCCFIFIIQTITPGHDSANYHLLFIIPAISAWLHTGRGKGAIVMSLILAGIIGPFVMRGLFRHFANEYKQLSTFAIPQGADLFVLFSNQIVPRVFFWWCLSIMLITMRRLKNLEQDSRAEAEEVSSRLSSICDNVGYSIFIKDNNRNFIYANKVMHDKLGLSPGSIAQKTDAVLGLERSEYLESDLQVLRDGKPFHDFEPDFTASDDGPYIMTTKLSLRDNSGKITGLLGICGSSIPETVGQAFSRIPYYMTLKDRDGYVIWANQKSLKDDLVTTWKELRAMNSGKGATDYQLYPKSEAEKYIADDSLLIRRADESRRDGSDPTSVAVVGQIEEHYFKKRNTKSTVSVTKIPWLNISGDSVLGVFVFFHEIDSSTKT